MLDSAAASSSDVRFRTPTSGLLRWSLAALMLGFVVFSWVAPGAADTPSERIFGPLVLLLLAAVFLSMGVTVRADRTRLLLVHTLFYRRALARDEIATVTAATWRPISFGGWGVKGWAATTKGLLLNASLGHRGDRRPDVQRRGARPGRRSGQGSRAAGRAGGGSRDALTRHGRRDCSFCRASRGTLVQ
jgi:hypothetical protein